MPIPTRTARRTSACASPPPPRGRAVSAPRSAYSPVFTAGFDESARDSHPFTQAVTARYVEMTITDNWRGFQGGTPGGDRVGLGEIAFEDAIPPPDPRIDITASLGLNLDGSVQTIDVPVTNLGATQALVLGTPTFSRAERRRLLPVSSPATHRRPGTSDLIQISFNPSGVSRHRDRRSRRHQQRQHPAKRDGRHERLPP